MALGDHHNRAPTPPASSLLFGERGQRMDSTHNDDAREAQPNVGRLSN